MAGRSPTQSSLKKLREEGYSPWKVEYWNAFSRRRVDAYGFIDIMAVHPEKNGVLAIQSTSYSNVSSRITKIREIPEADIWLQAGNRIVVHGWRKVKNKWTCREVWITQE